MEFAHTVKRKLTCKKQKQKIYLNAPFCGGETQIYVNGSVKFIKLTVPVITVKEEKEEDLN